MPEAWERSGRASKVGAGIVIAVLLAVFLFIPPNTRSSHPVYDKSRAMSNIRNVALALHAYSEEHGQLPPAATVDSEGRLLHSWRTLLLPYLDQRALYNSLDLSKPWDAPENQRAWNEMPQIYEVPGHNLSLGITALCAPVGPDYLFQETMSGSLKRLTAPASEVVMLVLVTRVSAVPWMQPKDTAEDFLLNRDVHGDSFYDDAFLLAFADGSTLTSQLSA